MARGSYEEDELLGPHRVIVAASGLLLAVLVSASVLAWHAVLQVRAGLSDVDRARAAVRLFDDVRVSVAREAFAEAAYRRAPSPATRDALVVALAGVPVALEPVLAEGTASDRATATQIAVLNRRYVDEVRRGLRVGSAPAGTTVDDRVAGPALAGLDQLAGAALGGHRAEATQARAEQDAKLSRLTVTVPVVLGAAVLAVISCWTVILRQHRRLALRARESEWASTHDSLTAVANRVLMHRELDAELSQGSPDAALVLIDLNHFKEVNDTFGHAAGDAVLVAVADRLTAATGERDLVARLGGDEFAVLVRPAARAAVVVGAIRERLHAPLGLPEAPELRCEGSIGTALARAGGDRVSLLREADLAMYDGKPRRLGVPGPRGPGRLVG